MILCPVRMASFDLEGFVAAPSLAVFFACRKGDLVKIAGYYNVSVSTALHVNEYREALLAVLVDQRV